MTYDLTEHRHRFAAWAAGRAAGTKNCRFTVEQGRMLLEGTDIPAYAADWEAAVEAPETFDVRHRQWRNLMTTRAAASGIGGNGRCFTHGVAAKIINVYLKSMIVCSLTTELTGGSSRAAIIHPPIDRLLLQALGKLVKTVDAKPKRGRTRWQDYADLGWSNFSSEQYEEVIQAIRIVANSRPLWQVEQHWIGHQTSKKVDAFQGAKSEKPIPTIE